MQGNLSLIPLVLASLGHSGLTLTDPVLDAFGHDRFQTPLVERPADPYAAGRFGPSRWDVVPPLESPRVPYPLAEFALLLAAGESPATRLSFGAWAPPSPRTCRRRLATFVRFGGESDAFYLLDCDGAVRNDGLERLSILARPPGTERPPLPFPEEPTASTRGEWVEHIRQLPPRLAFAVQRIVEAFPFRPVYIISGYRPGAGHGFHAQGNALDIFVMNVPNERVYKLCRRMNDMGCGYYPNNKFVHIDARPPGTGKAYWIDESAPGEPSRYVDAWPGVEKGGAAVWAGGGLATNDTMRVLFHAINGVGLGHLARTVALAIEARALGHEVLVLTSAADTSLLRRAGLDHVRLPPRLGEPHASPERALRSLDEGLERAAACAVLDAFEPELVAFDTHPPAWLVHHARGLRARVALVLRELRPEHRDRLLRGPLALRFDRILVPHEPDEVDEGAFPWFLPAGFLGPVLRPRSPRILPSPHGRPLLLVTAGGGGQPVDTRRFFQAAADAHWLLRIEFPTLETVLIQGPYGQPPERLPPGVRALGAVPEIAPWIVAADLVISQAGYNTVQELRALRAPVVLVPGRRRAEDQRQRARRLARSGAAVLAPPEASALADAIAPLLRDPARLDALRAAHAPPRPRNAEAARWLLGARVAPAQPLHVALVAHNYPPRLGGMETAAHNLARSLARRGHRVTVYTQARLDLPQDPGVTVRPLFTSLGPPSSIDLWSDLLLTLAASGRDAPDVLHLCNAGLAPWIPWLRAALACPVMVNVHGNDLVAPWTRHGLDPEGALLEIRRGLALADDVIAVSRFSASLAPLRSRQEPPRVILNGVDSELFCPGKEERMPWILTVSRMTPRKGHGAVIRALPRVLRRCPQARFVFTGEDDEQLRELRVLARSLGVEGALTPAGRVDEEGLRALYRRASVFALIPSADEGDVEGFGLALLEAAACGVPVVAGAAGGATEAARCVGGAVVPPDDPEALAEALLAHLDPPSSEGAEAASRGARSLALEHPWARTAEGYQEAFFAACHRWKPAPWPSPPPASAALPGASAEALEALRASEDAAALREASRVFAAARWREREGRKERHRWAIAAGKTVKLRATGAGRHRLPEALEDCAALGHRPALELRLSAALEPSFLPAVLPRISALLLLHAIPTQNPETLRRRLEALPPGALALVRSLRISWSIEARQDPALQQAALPEGKGLARLFEARGIPVEREPLWAT